jgi:hypothetical protein
MLQDEQTRFYDDQIICPRFQKNMESFPVVKTEETEDEIENMSSPSSSYIDILKDTSSKVNVRL